MGYYDIGVKYDKTKKLSYTSLCHELMDEYEKSTGKSPLGEDTYKSKLKNSQKSGLINKLNTLLGLDVEEKANANDKEKHDLLKILKVLFYIEKNGSPKYKKYDSNIRIQITDILRKPRLENIKTELSNKSVYGKYFQTLYDCVKTEVLDADARFKKIEKINMYWEYLTEKIFDYVITDKTLDNPKGAFDELDRINKFLQTRILARLSEDKIPKKLDDGIMTTFYNKLICHRMMCRDADRININYQICFSPEPPESFKKDFRKLEGCGIPKKTIKYIKNYICAPEEYEDVKAIINFILKGIPKEHWDKKAFKFAINNFETVLSWWIAKKNIDISKGIAFDVFVIIIQEMITVYNSKEGFKNDYLGYNNPNRSLSVAVKKPDEADAVAIEAWKKKLENRTAVNFGASTLIKKKREIENSIYHIKMYIYSYTRLSDIEFINEILCKFVARSIISRDLAMYVGNEFTKLICKYLDNNIKDITFIVPPEGVNVYNMFRDFTIDQFNIKELVAKDFAEKINELYNNKSGCYAKGMRCDFEIALSQERYWNNMVTFFVNRRTNQVIFEQYVDISSDDDCSRMQQLGLEEFIGDNKIRFF